MAEIDIIIDSMTDCLIHRETGEAYDTEYRLVRRAITAAAAKALNDAGWRFDWSRPQRRGYEVYELLVKGDDEVSPCNISTTSASAGSTWPNPLRGMSAAGAVTRAWEATCSPSPAN